MRLNMIFTAFIYVDNECYAVGELKHSPQPCRLPPSKGAKPVKIKSNSFCSLSPFEGGGCDSSEGDVL
jgi:hypothetical protein